jgi:hypoxanthine phosphoribosyltransferase
MGGGRGGAGRLGLAVTRRTFEGRRLWRLDHDAFAGAAALIAEAEQAHHPQLVIGVARGGRALADHLSTRMGVPAVMVSARHNIDDQVRQQVSGTVTVDPLPTLLPLGERVLVVDDICGSGATLKAVVRLLDSRLDQARLRTAVLCRNTGADITPHTWVWDVADWVCFPWETPPNAPTEPLPAPTTVRHST